MTGKMKNRSLATLAAAFRNRFSKEDGNIIVEMALAVPVLMILFTGVITFASAYNNQIVLTQAVGTGAQYLQQLRGSTTDPCKDTLTAIENAAPYLTPGSISLTVTMDGTQKTGNSCSGSQSDLVQGTAVTVLATYPCTLSIYNMKFTSSCQLSAEVTEYEY
jgi:Flp pilus assembly protein TadG